MIVFRLEPLPEAIDHWQPPSCSLGTSLRFFTYLSRDTSSEEHESSAGLAAAAGGATILVPPALRTELVVDSEASVTFTIAS